MTNAQLEFRDQYPRCLYVRQDEQKGSKTYAHVEDGFIQYENKKKRSENYLNENQKCNPKKNQHQTTKVQVTILMDIIDYVKGYFQAQEALSQQLQCGFQY